MNLTKSLSIIDVFERDNSYTAGEIKVKIKDIIRILFKLQIENNVLLGTTFDTLYKRPSKLYKIRGLINFILRGYELRTLRRLIFELEHIFYINDPTNTKDYVKALIFFNININSSFIDEIIANMDTSLYHLQHSYINNELIETTKKQLMELVHLQWWIL